MKKRIGAAILVIMLICTGIASAEIDFEAMTLDEVKSLIDEANGYYQEMTSVNKDTAETLEQLVMDTLFKYYGSVKISPPMLGFVMERAKDNYTVHGKIKVKDGAAKGTHEIRVLLHMDQALVLDEMYIDNQVIDHENVTGAVAEETSEAQASTPEPITDERSYFDYGELLERTDTQGICVLKYKSADGWSNTQIIKKHFLTVESFIKDGGGSEFEKIDYWAVADMTDGSQSKLISFTVPKWLIDAVCNGTMTADDMQENVEDLWLLPSLQK